LARGTEKSVTNFRMPGLRVSKSKSEPPEYKEAVLSTQPQCSVLPYKFDDYRK
jgi:hypothetical protein